MQQSHGMHRYGSPHRITQVTYIINDSYLFQKQYMVYLHCNTIHYIQTGKKWRPGKIHPKNTSKQLYVFLPSQFGVNEMVHSVIINSKIQTKIAPYQTGRKTLWQNNLWCSLPPTYVVLMSHETHHKTVWSKKDTTSRTKELTNTTTRRSTTLIQT